MPRLSITAVAFVGTAITATALCADIKPGTSKELSAPSSLPQPQSANPIYGGTLTNGTYGDPKTFNLWTARDSSSVAASELMFDKLIARNPYTLRWEARLAQLPEISPDTLTWTIRLKPGLRWSDGYPIDIDDVIFTLRVLSQDNPYGPFKEELVVETSAGTKPKKAAPKQQAPITYRRLSNSSLQITFPRPMVSGLQMLSFPVVPRHKLEEAFNAGHFKTAWDNKTPPKSLVSSGPWILESYEVKQQLTYVRNPNYWRQDAQGGSLPYLDRYRLRINGDWDSLQHDFLEGDLDAMPVPPEDYASLKQNSGGRGYQLYDMGPGWMSWFLTFNQNPKAGISADKIKLFSDVNFRRAVSHAINRESLIKAVFGGKATAQYGPVTRANTLFYFAKAPAYRYNLTEAKRLFRLAGLRDANHNGFWEWKGRELSLPIYIYDYVSYQLGLRIVNDLRKAGIKSVLSPIESPALTRKVKAAPFNWEATILFLNTTADPFVLRECWKSDGDSHVWNPRQKRPATRWEAETDTLINSAEGTFSENTLRKMYHRWQVLMGQQQPMIFLAAPHELMALRDQFVNLRTIAREDGSLNVEEIYDGKISIKPEER